MEEINLKCWHMPHAFGRRHRGESNVSETFFSSATKQSYREFPSCEWTSERRGSAKSAWWLGSVCLLLLFIHVFIPPVVIPSEPASLHPFLPLPQVPTRKHCRVTSGVIGAHRHPGLQLCVLNSVWYRKNGHIPYSWINHLMGRFFIE